MIRKIIVALLVFGGMAAESEAQRKKTFPGGLESIGYEFLLAKSLNLVFMPDTLSVFTRISKGHLVSLWGDPALLIDDDVAFPFVLPTTKRWVDWIKFDYIDECRGLAILTGGSRALLEQPKNAHPNSVHPAGMAVDLRPPPLNCLPWFLKTLRGAKEAGAINVIEEHTPPHYHIAVRPDLIDGFLAQTVETR